MTVEPTPPPDLSSPFAALLRHIAPEEIPTSEDLLSADQLRALLESERPYDLLFLGDVMLGEKLARRIDGAGIDYPFAGILPLLRKSVLVVANLEAPFATAPREPTERFSYRVPPGMASSRRSIRWPKRVSAPLARGAMKRRPACRWCFAPARGASAC